MQRPNLRPFYYGRQFLSLLHSPAEILQVLTRLGGDNVFTQNEVDLLINSRPICLFLHTPCDATYLHNDTVNTDPTTLRRAVGGPFLSVTKSRPEIAIKIPRQATQALCFSRIGFPVKQNSTPLLCYV